MKHPVLTGLVSFIVLLILGGCATTEITGHCRDPGYTGRIGRVLVLGVARKESTRRIFESAFANDLQNWGAKAVPSFTVLPEAGATEEQVRKAAGTLGVDTVLITKLVDLKKEKERVTDIDTDRSFDRPYPFDRRLPYYPFWYYDYSESYTTVRSYEIENKVLDLETNLYNYASGKLIWTALTRTTTAEPLATRTADIAQVLVKRLARDGLL